MTEGSSRQGVLGSYNAVSNQNSTSIVNVYQGIQPAPVDTLTLEAAEARLAELPLDRVPDRTSALPPGSHMALKDNPLFVGREADLLTLARTLKGGCTAAIGQVAAATGLGGIGKSALACAFAHRYGTFFSGGVFWLSFAQADAIPNEILLCAQAAAGQLRADFHSLTSEQQQAELQALWQDPRPRLLIFDNCEEEALLDKWRPPSGGSRVLVTSRRAEWSAGLGVEALPLGTLSREESIDLLRRFRPDLDAADPHLDAIAGALGDLPLALHLAGSYLKRYRHASLGQPASYLAEIRREDLLDHRSLTAGDHSPTGHEGHVARTFAISLDRLDPGDPRDAQARALLARAACFVPGEAIPRALLLATLEGAAAEEGEDALIRLRDLGLLEEQGDGAVVLHRLLAAFARRGAGDLEAAQRAVEGAVFDEAHRINDAGMPSALTMWQGQLRGVMEAAEQAGHDLAVALVNTLGRHLQIVGDYAGARAHLERALAIHKAALGPDHPAAAPTVNNLGLVLRDLGDLAGAREHFERALAIHKAALGSNHPHVATSLNNLGMVLQDLGDLAGAREHHERALAIREAALGPDHPDVATDLNNLGMVLQDLGELAGARELLQRALAIYETALGPNHPDVATTLNNLGMVLKDLGELTGARAHLERALAIWERALGPDHPDVASSANNLGLVLQDLGELAGARAYLERARAIREAALGPDHPDAATDLNNLGMVLHDLGELAGARAHLERAQAIRAATLGPDHPHVATDLNNLGIVLHDLGELAGAREHLERALPIGEAALGPDHRKTKTIRENLESLGPAR